MKNRNAIIFWILALLLAWCGRDGARLHGQTRPRPEQLRNIEQVRICSSCGDDRPGTLVLANQIRDGRQLMTPTGAPWDGSPDAGKPTACVQVFIRVALVPPPPPAWPAHNIQQRTCYTQVGLLGLLKNQAWLDWWIANGGPPIVAGVPIGPIPNPAAVQIIMDLLTHPRADAGAGAVVK